VLKNENISQKNVNKINVNKIQKICVKIFSVEKLYPNHETQNFCKLIEMFFPIIFQLLITGTAAPVFRPKIKYIGK